MKGHGAAKFAFYPLGSLLGIQRCRRLPRLLMMMVICLLFSASSFAQVFEPHPLNRPDGRDCSVSLCCVFQNEAEWLREWIEYHKLIGITHFYLYNNESKDKYLEVLSPYLLSGEVEIFEFPKTPLQVGDQQKIYNHALTLSKGHSKWLTAIDTDEFIVPWETKDLVAFLDSFPADIGSIEINWQTFGTSHVKKLHSRELLTEKLILRAPIDASINTWFKSIVKTDAANTWLNAHSCCLNPGYLNIRATPCGSSGVPEDEAAVSRIRIHHYIWRTENFFYQIKLPRIAKWDQNVFKCTSPIDYLPITNSILDLSMHYFTPPLREVMFGSKKK